MKTFAVLTILAFAIGAQTARTPGRSASPCPTAVDTWERQKECLEAARLDRVRQSDLYDKDSIITWNAHYSPKYGHCYIRVDSGMFTESNGKTITTDLMLLRDVLENAPIASVSHLGDELSGLGARIRSRKVTEAEATAFILDHMEN